MEGYNINIIKCKYRYIKKCGTSDKISHSTVCSVGLCEIPCTTTNAVSIILLTLKLKEYAAQSFIFGLGFMMC
jgi:hypothetical protein